MTINISSAKLFKIVQLLLLVIIAGLLVWSQPWNSSEAKADRSITVTGESTVEADPDEFTFYPYFEATGMDQVALQTELTEKANAAVEKLKTLGVEEKDIKLDASSYDRWYAEQDEKGTLNVRLTISTTDSEITQEVQDYLLTLDVKDRKSVV